MEGALGGGGAAGLCAVDWGDMDAGHLLGKGTSPDQVQKPGMMVRGKRCQIRSVHLKDLRGKAHAGYGTRPPSGEQPVSSVLMLHQRLSHAGGISAASAAALRRERSRASGGFRGLGRALNFRLSLAFQGLKARPAFWGLVQLCAEGGDQL